MQTRAARPAAEDIDAVLNRFQAWNSARVAKESGGGVREVSYDEALASGRGPGKKDAAVSHGTARVENAAGHVSAGQRPIAQHQTGQHAAARHSTGPALAAAVSPGPAEKKAVRRKRADGAPERKSFARVQTGGSETKREAVAKKARPSRQPEFRVALANSVGAALPGHADADRQVSMSLRVAPSERALIMIRAAEAGISVSAYLRQCALDVEILRAQVRQFMAVSARDRLAEFHQASGIASGIASAIAPGIASGGMAPASVVPPVKNEGWFSRWQRRIWGSGSGSRSAQLSLKA